MITLRDLLLGNNNIKTFTMPVNVYDAAGGDAPSAFKCPKINAAVTYRNEDGKISLIAVRELDANGRPGRHVLRDLGDESAVLAACARNSVQTNDVQSLGPPNNAKSR